jgi:hypothetical protein
LPATESWFVRQGDYEIMRFLATMMVDLQAIMRRVHHENP